MFKAGDKIVCVEPPRYEDDITLGGVYTFKCVREDFPSECYLEENGSSWYMSRFKLYEEPKPVFQQGDSLRCIDNSAVEMYLNKGEIYECKGMRTPKLVDVDTGKQDTYGYARYMAFDPTRFEKVVFEGAKYRETTARYKIDMTDVEEDFNHITQEQYETLSQRLAEQVKHSLNVEEPKPNKYLREIKPGVWVDIYDVLNAWKVSDPCLQHAAKKVLQCGERGHKDRLEDLNDILSSTERAIIMHKEWSAE